MSEPAEEAAASARAASGDSVDDLQRTFGVGRGTARTLADHGYTTDDVLSRLTDPVLAELGLDGADVERIRTIREARTPSPPVEPVVAPKSREISLDGEKIIDRWVDSVRKTERPRRRPVSVSTKDSAEVLRKWVQGDDRAMESWIQASEASGPMRSVPPPAPAETPAVVPIAPSPVPPAPGGPAPGPVAPALIPDQLREREETVVRWLTELLDRVKTDQFDPHSLLEEVQELHRQLYEERARRKQLDDELEHVKRGSIAVIKYVRSREAKTREQSIQAKDAEIAELRLKLLASGAAGEATGELSAPAENPDGLEGSSAPVPEATLRELERKIRADYEGREQAFVERETDLRRRNVQLEGEVRALRSESSQLQERAGITRGPSATIPEAVQAQLKEVEGRERDLVVRENELRSKFEEIRMAAEELERKKEPIAEREKELTQWEQQLKTARQAVELETRRLEQARSEVENSAEARVNAQELKKLTELQSSLLHKEAELKAREAFVTQRTEELQQLERGGEGTGERSAIQGAEAPEKRVKSGVRRLDDLLFGGYPPMSQIVVNGPAHTGKDVLARLFVAEGLKLGFPAIWVVTDKTYSQIREEMTALMPNYSEYEQKGFVRYVDLYARSLGVTQAEPGVRLLSSTDKAVLDQLTQTVNNYSSELKEKAPSYRLVFESVSTVTAYLDTTAMFRFLQPFTGRRKMEGATSYYLLETGMHSESDLQALEHMVDGSVNLKVEQLKTFLSVRGLGETQSRAWIGYTFTKKAFSLGSFSLDHIR